MVEPAGIHEIVPYQYTPVNHYRLWLVGDNILDNSHWNGVGKNTTAEALKSMTTELKVEIMDRSVPELDVTKLNAHLKDRTSIKVAQHFVEHRQKLGIPYDPPEGTIDVNFDTAGSDYIVISIGSSLFTKRHDLDPTEIVELIRQLIVLFKLRGLDEAHMYLLTPFPPSAQAARQAMWSEQEDLTKSYRMLVREAKAMCDSEGTNLISLHKFTDNERLTVENGSMQATRFGAIEIAKMIQEKVFKKIEKEENAFYEKQAAINPL